MTNIMTDLKNGNYKNGVATVPPPAAKTITNLVSLLVGLIEQNGELFGRCADSLSAFDIDLAEEAFAAAFEADKIVNKVTKKSRP